MFRIGEFSRIARVSGRLLRYYDSIGLLSPRRIDPATGYRYYAADQLTRLNRILALKDLGLSLEQVARMVDDRITTDEIRGMLLLKKAQLEQSLSEEAARLRHIESRLQQIDEEGALSNYDVVVKSAAAQPYLAIRRTFPTMDDVIAMVGNVARAVTARIPDSARDALVVVAYSDFEEEDLDLEIGFALTRPTNRSIVLPDRSEMAMTELPGVDSLATVARRGPKHQSHLAFGALGLWMEANGYSMAGPSREVFLELPFQRPDQEEIVMEIQFPVTKAA
ncbi:MAG: MerR family transcriptional regulator [Rhodospirillales bacterium]|nr:MerR family transcriptional regulator [Rhodospirillales bacterium]